MRGNYMQPFRVSFFSLQEFVNYLRLVIYKCLRGNDGPAKHLYSLRNLVDEAPGVIKGVFGCQASAPSLDMWQGVVKGQESQDESCAMSYALAALTWTYWRSICVPDMTPIMLFEYFQRQCLPNVHPKEGKRLDKYSVKSLIDSVFNNIIGCSDTKAVEYLQKVLVLDKEAYPSDILLPYLFDKISGNVIFRLKDQKNNSYIHSNSDIRLLRGFVVFLLSATGKYKLLLNDITEQQKTEIVGLLTRIIPEYVTLSPEDAARILYRKVGTMPLVSEKDNMTYGAYMSWSLKESDNEILDQLNRLFVDCWTKWSARYLNDAEIFDVFYGESRIGDPVKDASEHVDRIEFRFRANYAVPDSQAYGRMLLLLVDFARQLRLAWSVSDTNYARIIAGKRPLPLHFGVHVGPNTTYTQTVNLYDVPSATGIVFSPEAHYHARIVDLRVIYGKASSIGISEKNNYGVPVYGFSSLLYFSLPDVFVNASDDELESFGRLFAANPSDVFFGSELSGWYYHNRNFKAAIEFAMRVIAVAPDYPNTWDLTAFCYGNLAYDRASVPILFEKEIQQPKTRSSFEKTRWMRLAYYYHRSIQAVQRVIANTNDTTVEDVYVGTGSLYFLRGVNCLRWQDEELCTYLEGRKDEVCQLLHLFGFSWALSCCDSISNMFRRAAFEDLAIARQRFDMGMTMGTTKARSLFWRMLVESSIALLIQCENHDNNSPDFYPPQIRLHHVFQEIGWLLMDGTEEELQMQSLRVLDQAVMLYDQSILLDLYTVDVTLAYALLYWDFAGPSQEGKMKAIYYLNRCLEKREDKKVKDKFLVHSWGDLQLYNRNNNWLRRLVMQISQWEKPGDPYYPIFPWYVDGHLLNLFVKFFPDVS